MASQAKLSYMQGTLDTIAKFVSTYVSHRPTPQSLKFDPSLAAAIMKMAQANATSGLTQTPQATTARPPRLVLHAEISSAPVAFHDGEIRGRSFGSSAGFVFLHLRIKPAAQNGPYAQYAEKLLGGLNATNYYPLRDDIVQNWSDTSIQLRFPKGYWQELLSAASNVAHTRNIPPPQKSDIQACYQVSLSDEEKSDYFCAE
jgi:hypothetical protein